VAVLRYRLYDIDWIINRTLVYFPLTAILAGMYIAMTGVMRAVLVEGPGSDATVALTTVIVVAMPTLGEELPPGARRPTLQGTARPSRRVAQGRAGRPHHCPGAGH
jgi:hypothetical protein